MHTVSKKLKVIAIAVFFTIFVDVANSANCNGCNIVYQFGINGFDVGGKYELFDGTIVIVEQVNYGYRQAFVRNYYTGSKYWVDVNKLYGYRTAAAPRNLNNSQYSGLVASCSALVLARRNNDILGMFLMERACCQSSAARSFPEVSGPACR